MVLNNVIVRADFVDGEIVPLCFQKTRNTAAYHIGRIIATKTRPLDGHTEYTCRLKNSDQIVTLILDITRYGAKWSVDMDCDDTDRGITFGVLGKGQSFTDEDKTAEKEGESNGTPV